MEGVANAGMPMSTVSHLASFGVMTVLFLFLIATVPAPWEDRPKYMSGGESNSGIQGWTWVVCPLRDGARTDRKEWRSSVSPSAGVWQNCTKFSTDLDQTGAQAGG